MRSIINEWAGDTTDARSGPEEQMATLPDAIIESGLKDLIALVSLVAKPVDLEAERRALLAVNALYARSPLSKRARELHDELARCVQLIDRSQAQNLVDWINSPVQVWCKLDSIARCRHRRLMLLFILLAKTIGRVQEYSIPGILEEMSSIARAERLDEDLGWLPYLFGGERYFEVAGLYVDLSQRVLLENLLTDSTDLTVAEFDSWSWVRRVLHLKGWRESWALHDSTNPAWCGHRLEYQLARAGSFRRLSRRGGRLARRAIGELAYRDILQCDASWPRGTLVAFALVITLAVGSWWIAHRAAISLAVANESLTTAVEKLLMEGPGHE